MLHLKQLSVKERMKDLQTDRHTKIYRQPFLMFLRTVATVKTAVSNGKNERQADILRYTDRLTNILDVPEDSCDS